MDRERKDIEEEEREREKDRRIKYERGKLRERLLKERAGALWPIL